MVTTRRAVLVGLSTLAAPAAWAQPSPKNAPKASSENGPKAPPEKAPPENAPKQASPEPATLEKPVLFDIATTSGSLKESVQNGQQLIWHRKGQPSARFFEITNIAVGLLRSETGGQVTVTFSCNVNSLGYMTPEEAKLNLILRTKGGAALHSWSLGIAVKCTDKSQSLPPQTHDLPKEIAVNVFTNAYAIEIAEYTEANVAEQKAEQCA
jgi:hypothetical protein